jgi:hypothetical protein
MSNTVFKFVKSVRASALESGPKLGAIRDYLGIGF